MSSQKRRMCFTKFGDEYLLDGESAFIGRSLSLASGVLRITQDEHLGPLHFSFSGGVDAPSYEEDVSDDGEYLVNSSGIVKQREHPKSFKKWLKVLNIPEECLFIVEWFSTEKPNSDQKGFRYPNTSSVIRITYRSVNNSSHLAHISRIEVLPGCTQETFVAALTIVKIGKAMPLAFLAALGDGLEETKAWLKENLVISYPHHHCKRDFEATHCLELCLRSEVQRYHDHRAIYDMTKGRESKGIARAFHLLVEKFGLYPLLKDVVGKPDYIVPELPQNPISAGQPAYALAESDIVEAANYLFERYSIIAVKKVGSEEPFFCIRYGGGFSFEDPLSHNMKHGKITSLSVPSDICISGGEAPIRALLEKHGIGELSELLYAMVPHNLRLKVPDEYANFYGFSEHQMVVYGNRESVEGEENPSPKAIALQDELVSIGAKDLSGQATCISDPNKNSLLKEARIVSFLRDGEKGHANCNFVGSDQAMIYLPADGKERIFVAVVVEPRSAMEFGSKIGNPRVSVWAFSACRTEGRVVIREVDTSLSFFARYEHDWQTQLFYTAEAV